MVAMANAVSNLSSLLAKTSLGNHDDILKAANESLKKNKADVQAQHARAVALLKLDRYDDALKAFEEGGQPLQQAGQLEYAYSLYKCGKLDQAAIVAGIGSSRTSLKHVEAQATYKLEQFPRAQSLYNELSQSGGRDSESDLRINQGAVDAQLSWSGAGPLAKRTKAEREDLEQFETAYNAACGYVARGEWKQALTLLARARGMTEAEGPSAHLMTDDEQTYVTLWTIYLMMRSKLSCYQSTYNASMSFRSLLKQKKPRNCALNYSLTSE